MSGYKYRGDPGWKPGDPRYRESAHGGQTAALAERAARHAERIQEYIRLRDEEKLSIGEAGRRLDPPIGIKTAYGSYEQAYKALLRERALLREPAS